MNKSSDIAPYRIPGRLTDVIAATQVMASCMFGAVIVFGFLSVEFIELKNDLDSRWNP
jgi:hypothetical protein